MVDGSTPLSFEDRVILAEIQEKKGLVVVNKVDLPQRLDLQEIGRLCPEKKIVVVSALEGRGLEELQHDIRELFLGDAREPEVVISNARHKAALERTRDSLGEAAVSLREGMPPEMVAVDLQEAQHSLEEIVGAVTNEDILARIFSQFCLGK